MFGSFAELDGAPGPPKLARELEGDPHTRLRAAGPRTDELGACSPMMLVLLLLIQPVAAAGAPCSAAKPCVSADHDCGGHDIEVGRNGSFTQSGCLALCKATKGCQGFVLDAISAEEKGQCKIAPKPGEACCLLKTSCVHQTAKKGDTAVSFLDPPPPPAPPPPLQHEWCPAYHKINSANICDPSGPIQTADGVCFLFISVVFNRKHRVCPLSSAFRRDQKRKMIQGCGTSSTIARNFTSPQENLRSHFLSCDCLLAITGGAPATRRRCALLSPF